MKTFFRGLLAFALAGLAACSFQVNDPARDQPANPGTRVQQEEIHAAATAVAALLDEGRYADAWDTVGPLLVAQTNREQWARNLALVRTPLGAPGQRTVAGFGFPESLDDAPPGEYGLVGYRTDFANAAAVEEKFVFQRINGTWKLAGYWLSKKMTLGTDDSSLPRPPGGA